MTPDRIFESVLVRGEINSSLSDKTNVAVAEGGLEVTDRIVLWCRSAADDGVRWRHSVLLTSVPHCIWTAAAGTSKSQAIVM